MCSFLFIINTYFHINLTIFNIFSQAFYEFLNATYFKGTLVEFINNSQANIMLKYKPFVNRVKAINMTVLGKYSENAKITGVWKRSLDE